HPALERRLPRRVLAKSRSDHQPHDAFIHLLRIELRPLHGFTDNQCTQLRRAQIGKRSLEFSNGRTTSGNDDGILELRHTVILESNVVEADSSLYDGDNSGPDSSCIAARLRCGGT